MCPPCRDKMWYNVRPPCRDSRTQLWRKDIDLISLQLQGLEFGARMDGSRNIHNVIVSEN